MSRDSFHAKVEKVEEMIHSMGRIIHGLLSELTKIFHDKSKISQEHLEKMLSKESHLDELEFMIERHCTELIALQQPMAIDLRNLMCMIKISMDLERMGDHIRKIIRKTRKVSDMEEFYEFSTLSEMTKLLRDMVDQILLAFRHNDMMLAKETLKQDEKINEWQRFLFQKYIDNIVKNPKETTISSAIYLLFITRFLERIGDHVENIGERIIYKITGDFEELNQHNY